MQRSTHDPSRLRSCMLAAALGIAASQCSSSSPSGGGPPADAGTTMDDRAMPATDRPSMSTDTGTPQSDTGTRPGDTGTPPGDSGGATSADWSTDATDYRGRNGQRINLTCPAGGKANDVWGTDLYTDDSSVCTAAVHAGRITLAAGGAITIEIRAGAMSYMGSMRNGITTMDYGAWEGSFAVVPR